MATRIVQDKNEKGRISGILSQVGKRSIGLTEEMFRLVVDFQRYEAILIFMKKDVADSLIPVKSVRRTSKGVLVRGVKKAREEIAAEVTPLMMDGEVKVPEQPAELIVPEKPKPKEYLIHCRRCRKPTPIAEGQADRRAAVSWFICDSCAEVLSRLTPFSAREKKAPDSSISRERPRTRQPRK